MSSCKHQNCCAISSPYSTTTGYSQPTPSARVAATLISGRAPKSISPNAIPSSTTFPAPLVLPEDALAVDPKAPPQSLRSWRMCKDRNPVTRKRNVIYVAETAAKKGLIPGTKERINDWSIPRVGAGGLTEELKSHNGEVDVNLVTGYMKAFFAGLPVQRYPHTLTLEPWDEPSRAKKKSADVFHIALTLPTESVQVRVRKMPSDSPYRYQLSALDLLDALESALPDDAYAILLLTQHDLYEDEEDEFIAGRAFGGSRIAVVSTARYDPRLDFYQEIDITHAWPASHCLDYISGICEPKGGRKKHQKKEEGRGEAAGGLLKRAIEAYTYSSLSPTSTHLFRVCRTASHELAHCLALDHCIYYACAMQATCSVREDARQPPYLCPICMAKVGEATKVNEKGRLREIMRFSERLEGAEWAALKAWVSGRIEEISEMEG